MGLALGEFLRQPVQAFVQTLTLCGTCGLNIPLERKGEKIPNMGQATQNIKQIKFVKLVYKDQPRDGVLIPRWSSYAGSITWNVYHWAAINVLFLDSWSLYTGGLQSRFGSICITRQHWSTGNPRIKCTSSSPLSLTIHFLIHVFYFFYLI